MLAITVRTQAIMVAFLGTPFPSFPESPSVCVTGPYSPPLPIYACINAFLDKSNFTDCPTVLVTSSRERLLAALNEHNDEWLSKNSGTGKLSRALSNMTIVYEGI